ncbi:MAG TPA: AbrB/MazE/SpoVT family DNA-binding domain-containing protein [Dehalococcoidia bacterium]|nr:AbrB/MazE/SpoVT family DNA-binding domain-containing protein [Dehalococcoidia bacterium]
MTTYRSSLSPKGQITLPAEVRRRLGLRPKDMIAIEVQGDLVTIRPAENDSFLARYRTIPALRRQLSVEEMTEIAAEEHAQTAAREGL